MNTSRIRPQGHNIIVRGKTLEKKTEGGIIIPESVLDKRQHDRMEGTLLAFSPIAFTYEGDWMADDPYKPKVGDTVVYFRYAGTEIEGMDGEKYHIMKDIDIAGVVENG